jgi:hypothetical protein
LWVLPVLSDVAAQNLQNASESNLHFLSLVGAGRLRASNKHQNGQPPSGIENAGPKLRFQYHGGSLVAIGGSGQLVTVNRAQFTRESARKLATEKIRVHMQIVLYCNSTELLASRDRPSSRFGSFEVFERI